MSMRLSIVIPAHNEEHRIRPMLDAYLAYFLPRLGDAVEFLVVVNYSTDTTAEIIRGYSENHPQVKLILEPAKVGKGGALMLGFHAACGELIGFVDADGATAPEAFNALVEDMGAADCVIGSRWLKGSVVNPRQPLKRRIISRMFNGLVSLFFNMHLTDTQCGAKLMRGNALRSILPCMGITRWAFDVDLLVNFKRAGFSIKEIPTIWSDISGSRVRMIRASCEMLLAITRLRLLYSPFRWLVKVYDLTLGRVIKL